MVHLLVQAKSQESSVMPPVEVPEFKFGSGLEFGYPRQEENSVLFIGEGGSGGEHLHYLSLSSRSYQLEGIGRQVSPLGPNHGPVFSGNTNVIRVCASLAMQASLNSMLMPRANAGSRCSVDGQEERGYHALGSIVC